MKNAAKPTLLSLLHPIFPTLIGAFILLAAGCEGTNEPAGGNRFTMSAMYSNGQTGAAALKTALPASVSGSVDSVTVSRARIVLSKLKLESDDDTVMFRTPPFVLELNLAGRVQQIAVSSVPPGAYDEVTLKIHRIDSADVAGLPSGTADQFADFLADGGYSIIIEGRVYRNADSGTAFTYRSAVSKRLEFDLRPPVVVSDSVPTANVTFIVGSEKWFKGGEGCLIDPADSTNRERIDENLARSVQMVKDHDCNGYDDDEYAGRRDSEDDGGHEQDDD
jgi:hypothetical protein